MARESLTIPGDDSPTLEGKPSQPAWPFEYEIKDRAVEGKTEDGEAVVYLVEGEQLGYLAAEVAGEAWNR